MINNLIQKVLVLFNPSVDSITKDFTNKIAKLDALKQRLANKNKQHLDAAFDHNRKAMAALDEFARADRIRNRINQLIEE